MCCLYNNKKSSLVIQKPCLFRKHRKVLCVSRGMYALYALEASDRARYQIGLPELTPYKLQ